MRSPVSGEIPFGALISITGRGRFVFLNDRLRPRGLSAGRFPVLMLLFKEQNIMQEILVRHYNLDKGTIARSVRKLKDAGYIRRIIDPDNRRAVRLFLTKKGEKAAPFLQAIDREWEERMRRSFRWGYADPQDPDAQSRRKQLQEHAKRWRQLCHR